MWDQFTVAARNAVYYSQALGQKSGKDAVDTEHLLMGIIADENSHAWQILTKLGVGREALERAFGYRTSKDLPTGPDVRATQNFKDAIDHVRKEAASVNSKYIGTEHILLGLALDRSGRAGMVLFRLNVRADQLKELVVRVSATGNSTDINSASGEIANLFQADSAGSQPIGQFS